MVEHVVTVSFAVESEAYQALSELKRDAVNAGYVISQVGLVTKENGHVVSRDGFDTGVETQNDTAAGGLIGALVGVLGGPIGVLLGASWGRLTGAVIDASDASRNVSLLEHVCDSLPDGKAALLVLVQELVEGEFDKRLAKYEVTITKQDAAEVAVEVEKAQELARQMEKEARKQLRAEKKEERKAKVAQKQDELKEKFNSVKAKFIK